VQPFGISKARVSDSDIENGLLNASFLAVGFEKNMLLDRGTLHTAILFQEQHNCREIV
jgi:hypothetical protein